MATKQLAGSLQIHTGSIARSINETNTGNSKGARKGVTVSRSPPWSTSGFKNFQTNLDTNRQYQTACHVLHSPRQLPLPPV
jgi:hypothetical protein